MNTGHLRIDEAPEAVIIGSDEVGYGCMAGPLLVVAVATPKSWSDPRVTDSKALTAKKREKLYKEFFGHADFPQAMVAVSNDSIDKVGVTKALYQAHTTALRQVVAAVEVEALCVVDGNFPIRMLDVPAPLVCLPKGDLLVPACGLASILAKHARDGIMAGYDHEYPGYGFGKHMGYVTPAHKKALEELGPCPIHRRSYAPVQRALAYREDEFTLDSLDDLL